MFKKDRRTEPDAESRIGHLTLRFNNDVHKLAEALKDKAIEEIEQEVQATTQAMLNSAKTEAEEIVQAATQRVQQAEQEAQAAAQSMLDGAKTEIVGVAARIANDLDTKVGAMTRDLTNRINGQFTSSMAAIEDMLSNPVDSGNGPEDDPDAPVGNQPST